MVNNNNLLLDAAAIAEKLDANIAQCDAAQTQINSHYNQQAGYRYANIDEIVVQALKALMLQLKELATLLKERADNSVIYENPGSLASLNEVFHYCNSGDFINKIATDKNFCGRHDVALELFRELLAREISVLKAEVALDQLKVKRLQTRDKIKVKKLETTRYAVLKENPEVDNDELAAKLAEFQAGRHHTIDGHLEGSLWIGNGGMSVHFYDAEFQAVFDIVEMPIIPPHAT
ncbi:MAG: hypothetical protein C0508_03725 [Cyanobacteria bacterium PR.023]|nr:hypothetical protein [Cyanobacteria bacterium PR.023]